VRGVGQVRRGQDPVARLAQREADGLRCRGRVQPAADVKPLRGDVPVPALLVGEDHFQDVAAEAAVDLTVINLDFTDGGDYGITQGGAIDSDGTLTVEGGTFWDNKTDEYGGAIVTDGQMTVSHATFTGNLAPYGGACTATRTTPTAAPSLRPVRAAQPLPSGRGHQGGQLIRALGACASSDHLAAGHRQHVAGLLPFQPSAQLRVPAVHLITGHPRERDSRLHGTLEHLPGSSGLVANATSSPIPAARHRSRSPAHFSGRYSSGRSAPGTRPVRHRPGTPSPGSSPTGPQSRSTCGPRLPTSGPFQEPSLIHRQYRRRIPQVAHHVPGQRVPACVLVPRREVEQPLHPVRRHVPPPAPPATRNSSAPCATAAPVGTPGRAGAPPRSRKPPRPARTSH
jgi:hypothetical protein